MAVITEIRIDKWLWAVRVFKTRTLAADECRKGRVIINGNAVKPSHFVKLNEIVIVRKPPVVHTFKVMGIIENRVSAQLAKLYVLDLTPDDEITKREIARLSAISLRDSGTGRPTKKDRRDIDKLMDL
jgi:ribosome-associated heat shock protein Hsp15